MTQNSSSSNGSSLKLGSVCRVCDALIADLGSRRELKFPIPIGALLDQAERMLGPDPRYPFRILLHPRSWGSRHLAGLLLRYQDRAEIVYSLSFNTCWRRFVIVKELAHLLLDKEESFTRDPVGLVQGLINDIPNMDNRSDLKSEQISPFAAIELLLPWSFRTTLYEMEAQGHSHLQIAQFCRVPQKIVSLVLSASYRKASEQANLG